MRRITREHFNFNPSFYSYIHTHEEFKNNRDLKLITKTFLFTKECFLSNPIILSLLFTILFELNFYTFFQDHPGNRSRVGRYEETIQSATFIESTSFDNASKSTGTKPPRSFPRFSLALCFLFQRLDALLYFQLETSGVRRHPPLGIRTNSWV